MWLCHTYKRVGSYFTTEYRKNNKYNQQKMKKILIPALLFLIVYWQKNTSNKPQARSYTDSIMELSEKINKTDTVKITEKEKNNDKITELKNIYNKIKNNTTDRWI